jgi:hypothetical protein
MTAVLISALPAVANSPVDFVGREMRTFLIKQGSLSEVAGASTVSVWTPDDKTREAIVKRIRGCSPAVAIIRGEACARVSITFHVQERKDEGPMFGHPRFNADADIQVRGYSCDTTTQLSWYDEGTSSRQLIDRFGRAVCQVLPPANAK